jgi:hypothetical protein
MDTKHSVTSKQAVRCAIYARSASGTESEKQSAVAHQIARCREAANANDFTVAEDCIRTDAGKSGVAIKSRSGLQELMTLAATKPRPFSALICDSSDRLARNFSIVLQIVDALIFNGVSVHFASDGCDTGDPNFRYKLALMSQVDVLRPKGHRQMTWQGMLRCNCQKAKNAAATQVATTPACNHACADCSRLQ